MRGAGELLRKTVNPKILLKLHALVSLTLSRLKVRSPNMAIWCFTVKIPSLPGRYTNHHRQQKNPVVCDEWTTQNLPYFSQISR